MKSVKTKIIALVLTFVVFSSLAIGTTSMISSLSTIESTSIETMNLLCENKANNINTLLVKIEESVKTLTVYAQHQLKDLNQFKKSSAYVDDYSKNLYSVAVNAAMNTEGATTVYIRYNPSFTSSKSGIFSVKDDSHNTFVSLEPTDLNAYEPTDMAHVGWFYKAKENAQPIWLEPYYNENIKKEIISYIIPFYEGDEFVGIVGMDVDFDMVRSEVSQTKLYKTGYAFLVDEKAEVVYHQDIERNTDLISYNDGEFSAMARQITQDEMYDDHLIEYTYGGIDKKATFRFLLNNMRFITTVPTSEIDAQSNKLLTQMVMAMFVIISLAIALTFIFTKRFIKPLTELTNAAKKIAGGDLSVSIEHHSNDEIGELAESFRQTVDKLNQQFTYINSLAYIDPLTGISNKTAYLETIERIEQYIHSKSIEFAIVAFDLNNLKVINDTYGHHLGDLLIVNSVHIIQDVFKDSLVYRIGGDEFIVILQDDQYIQRKELISKFTNVISEHNNNLKDELLVSIAIGVSEYDKNVDHSYSDVYKRADNAMYTDKLKTKNKDKL
ncbi:MAG: diguanylate cyclase [Bacilli bacterium]